MLSRGILTQLFRNAGLMHRVDRAKFFFHKWKNRKANTAFQREHPGLSLPPDYLMFEAFNLDYRRYYEGGRESARWLVGEMEKHSVLTDKKVLDWGCGPARIIRHLPALMGPHCTFYGTDYNPQTISWCRQHIEGVEFSQNALLPPTGYPDEFFDILYGISIFTHLSEANHRKWFEELIRISRKDALLLLTTQGKAFVPKLTPTEQKAFSENRLVVRGKVVEGHRVFSTFHPPAYMKKLFGAKAEVLAFTPGESKSWGIEQDLWALRKK